MIVADIGNSDIVIAGIDHESIHFHFRFKSNIEFTKSELFDKIKDNLNSKGIILETITQSIICSVVPSLTPLLTEVFEDIFNLKPMLVKIGAHSEVSVGIDDPDELGCDLYANAVYAYLSYKKPCVIVDFGTALTFTAVSKEGVVAGVAIAPGLKTAVNALFSNTAQLPDIKLEIPEKAIGKNSIEAIRSGILIGYEGLVKNIIAKMKSELGNDTVVLATGGLSLVMHTLKGEFQDINRDLTLLGIYKIALAYR